MRQYEIENEELRQTIDALETENKALEKQRRLNKENTIQTIQEYQRFEEENHSLNQEINDLTEHNQELIEQNQTYLHRLRSLDQNNGLFTILIPQRVQGYDFRFIF